MLTAILDTTEIWRSICTITKWDFPPSFRITSRAWEFWLCRSCKPWGFKAVKDLLIAPGLSSNAVTTATLLSTYQFTLRSPRRFVLTGTAQIFNMKICYCSKYRYIVCLSWWKVSSAQTANFEVSRSIRPQVNCVGENRGQIKATSKARRSTHRSQQQQIVLNAMIRRYSNSSKRGKFSGRIQNYSSS